MLSGIRIKVHLSEVGIKVILDLPSFLPFSGNGFADHGGTIILYKKRQYILAPPNPTGLNADLSTVPFTFLLCLYL